MAAAGAPIRVPVAVACEVLGFSRQGYYQWLKNPVTQRDWDDAHLIDAALESFFALLQKNVLNTRRWETREELRLAIVTWIETKYHRRRRQRRLGKLTPIEFETIYAAANAA